jgi:hypothetical protein
MKVCSKCKKTKELEAFYRNQRSKDGLASYCKDCDRLICRASRAAHLEAHRAVDKAYYERHKERIRARHTAHRIKYKDRHAAHKLVFRALAKGILTKQPCEMCGSLTVQAHHDDYGKPLEVRWLCLSHHMRLHWGKGD